MEALSLLQSPLQSFSLMETLVTWVTEGHEAEAVSVLHAIVKKARFPDFRWNYREGDIKNILKAGIEFHDLETKGLAKEAQDVLLRNQCSEYLDLYGEANS